MRLDEIIFQYINSFAGRYLWLDALTVFFAKYFGYVLVLLLVLFLFRNYKKYWQMTVWSLFTAFLARFVIVDIIRWIWARPRPFVENNVNLLVDRVNQSAFPSGHAAFFFAIATFVYLYNKKAGILFFFASFLISISRVFVGIHWPSDILAGAVTGILSSFLIILFFRKFFLTAEK